MTDNGESDKSSWVRRMRRAARRRSWLVTAVAIVGVAVAVTWGALVWLLAEADKASDPPAARVEAIKTGLGIGAGTGGVLALVLAARRQWHQERTAEHTTHDAHERRITELYARAVEQLGSDKAPVRLGALYALERLGQHSPYQQPAVANIVCAYLRMPHEEPTDPDDAIRHRQRYQEETEVRKAAQRILAKHLRTGPDYWPDIQIDLTEATLINFTLQSADVPRGALFTRAKFTGATVFLETVFCNTLFAQAEFDVTTSFYGCDMHGRTFFDNAKFAGAAFVDGDWGGATFRSAQFSGALHIERVSGMDLTDARIKVDSTRDQIVPLGWTIDDTPEYGDLFSLGEGWGTIVRSDDGSGEPQ